MLQSIEENGVDSASENEDDNNNESEYIEPWVRIQHNTFVNWMNDKLRVFDLECTSLQKDLKVCQRKYRLFIMPVINI